MENLKPGCVMRHHSGRVYTVLFIANVTQPPSNKFPLTVVYMGANGQVWARPYVEFVDKFTFLYDGNNLA